MEQTSDSGFVGKLFDEKSTNEFTDYIEMPCVGFNRLFRAKRYGKRFVLKGLKPEYSSNPFYHELLAKEFELGMMLSHPNIVTIHGREYDAVLGDCIVMEYVDGMTLTDFIDSKPSAEAVRKVVDEILSAMSYFHSLQVVHRDIKPSNILITRNGNNVKIIDFGFSDTDSHAILKQPAGTARYAAPEQYDGNVAIDCRADIYSFGMVLKDIVSATKIGGYKAVIRKCTQYDREKRYANAIEIQKAIANHRRLKFLAPIAIMSIVLVLTVALWFHNTEKSTHDEHVISADTIVRVDTVVGAVYEQALFDEAKVQIDALSATICAKMSSDTLLTDEEVATYLAMFLNMSLSKCDSIASQLEEGSVLQSQFVSHWNVLFERNFFTIQDKYKSPHLYDFTKVVKSQKTHILRNLRGCVSCNWIWGLLQRNNTRNFLRN